MSEKSSDLWRGGWLHTGDIAYLDEDGYVVITDRLKDVIKTGGEWVSSLELESLISQHEAVAEAAVIGIPDEKWGERPAAFVVEREAFKGKLTPDVAQGLPPEVRRRGPHRAVGDPRPGEHRGRHPEDQRRQAGQEVAPRRRPDLAVP